VVSQLILYESKPTLDLIEPGTAGGREIDVEAALFAFAPALAARLKLLSAIDEC
jgi:hypothetical protein